MIDLDITFVIQFVNFIVTLLFLNILLIRPIREIIKARNERMADLADSAQAFTQSADDKVEDYEVSLDEARKAGVEERTTFKDEGTAEAQNVMSAAGEDVAGFLSDKRKEIEKEKSSAMQELQKSVDSLADAFTAKVV
jgi:F-type H+-transporting ATPase subunit b